MCPGKTKLTGDPCQLVSKDGFSGESEFHVIGTVGPMSALYSPNVGSQLIFGGCRYAMCAGSTAGGISFNDQVSLPFRWPRDG